MTVSIFSLAVALCMAPGLLGQPMDYGGTGVWDSPMATDYWVKRFGFMWGGGNSGMYAIKALQSVSSPSEAPQLDKNIYNPSGMYGMKAMDPNAPEYSYPGQNHQVNSNSGAISYHAQTEKSMVELSPLKVAMPGENKQMSFNRFMAVP